MFSIFNVSSIADNRPDDRTTRARIRDAAIRRFAADGMDAPLRAVATDVGASAALIVHHFGSRAGLRQECDVWVLDQIHQHKTAVLGSAGATAMLTQLAHTEGYAHLVGYVLRCLQAGGDLSKRFLDQMVADSEKYLHTAEEAGTVSRSRDPAARARIMTEMALGALLLQLPGPGEHLDLDSLPDWLRTYSERIVLPMLEIYTEPLLTDSSLLDAYLASTHTHTNSPTSTTSTTSESGSTHG